MRITDHRAAAYAQGVRACARLAGGLAATPLVFWIPVDRFELMPVKPSAYLGAALVAGLLSLALALVAWSGRDHTHRW